MSTFIVKSTDIGDSFQKREINVFTQNSEGTPHLTGALRFRVPSTGRTRKAQGEKSDSKEPQNPRMTFSETFAC